MRQPAIPRFTLVGLGADTGRIGAIPWIRLSPVCMVETNRWPSSSAARLSAGEGVFLCSVLMPVFLLPVIMACEKTRLVNCSRTALYSIRYVARHHAVSQGSPYGSRRAQGRLMFKKLGALFLQPRSQGRYSAASFRGGQLNTFVRSLGKKLAWRRKVDCAIDPVSIFCLCKGCGGSRNFNNDNPDKLQERSGRLMACLAIRELAASLRCGAYLQDAWANNPHSLEITSGVAQSQVVGRTTAGDLSPY